MNDKSVDRIVKAATVDLDTAFLIKGFIEELYAEDFNEALADTSKNWGEDKEFLEAMIRYEYILFQLDEYIKNNK